MSMTRNEPTQPAETEPRSERSASAVEQAYSEMLEAAKKHEQILAEAVKRDRHDGPISWIFPSFRTAAG